MSTAKVPGIPERYVKAFGTREEREADLEERRKESAERRQSVPSRSAPEHDPDASEFVVTGVSPQSTLALFRLLREAARARSGGFVVRQSDHGFVVRESDDVARGGVLIVSSSGSRALYDLSLVDETAADGREVLALFGARGADSILASTRPPRDGARRRAAWRRRRGARLARG